MQCPAGLLVQLEEKRATYHSGLEHCKKLQAQDEVREKFLLFAIPPSCFHSLFHPSFFPSLSRSSSLTVSLPFSLPSPPPSMPQAKDSGLMSLLDELRSEEKVLSDHIHKLLHCLQRIASS